ncbi:FtsX-like permease family protein [Actinoplanes derwentensis]|uniref:Putative ABC transport system permease protein n=1 Tax=Actinoplanes derwentensis TaxID=113562 RepID=A0A1H2DE21_9ACTN|nr:ABC transporter permease [Actinoplanes derwentensis]GID84825.1 ABC transporter permease [Actinoplanes derwentensis]SDT81005.1 putative ABC transport system permease protein [Actinoplanes derwentensis]
MIFTLAWSQVRSNPGRLLAIVAAVVLATGFLAATATFASTSDEGLRLTAAAPLTTADIVLDAGDTVHDPNWYQVTGGVPGVRTVDAQFARTVSVFGGARRGSANVQSIPATPQVRWFDIDEGAWPSAAGQVVADRRTLTDLGVGVGATLVFRQGAADPVTVTVVGSADLGFRPLTGSDYRFYAAPAFFAGDTPPAALLTVADRDRLAETVGAVGKVLPQGATATDASVAADMAAARFAGGNTQLVVIMLAFAAVALLASILVIANTFQMIVSQRIRQVALLRLVGGHRRQVSRVVLTEAAIAGSIGAVLGAVAGVGIGYLGAGLLDINGGGLAVSPIMLVLCVLTGVAATVVAAWAPARGATRVPPVRALQDIPETLPAQVHGGRRLAVGLALLVFAVGALVGAGVGASLPLALVGGVLLAAGLLIALPLGIALLLPPTARGLERFGVAAGLAGGSLRQNARRTASATMAVVVGAALITSLAVASASGRATVEADLEARYPVAVSVHTDGAAIDDRTVQALAGIPGLSTTTVQTTAATFPAAGKPTPARIASIPAGLGGRLAPELGMAGGGPVLLLPNAYLTARGLKDGAPITIKVDDRDVHFTARGSRLADTTGQLLGVASGDALTAAGVRTVPTAVWGTAPGGFDRESLAGDVNAVAARDAGVEVGGGLTEGGDIMNVLSILLGLSLGMLAVTVVIALLGIANLLGLSVIERAREMALLRALGTRSSRLRAMVAIEAVTITLLGTVAGIVIGVPVGLVGVIAAVGRQADPVIRPAWPQLGLVLVAAAVTGVLASLAPARRATRIAPAEGLVR